MRMEYETLLLNQLKPGLLQVTLNRPERYNAINSQMMQDLLQFWLNVTQYGEEIRCIILTGSGDKAFCAGADLKERQNIDLATWRKQHIPFEQAMMAMIDCPIPVIAAVNGVAFGGGLEILLAADFAYAAAGATFAQSETKLGLMPGAMGTQNLPKACGVRRAKELAFTAETFTAEQALEWGIVNAVYTSDLVLAAAIRTAEHICSNAPLAVRQTKKAINMSQHLDVKNGFAFELEAYYRLLPTKDREEGIQAFNEKRAPKFTGE